MWLYSVGLTPRVSYISCCRVWTIWGYLIRQEWRLSARLRKEGYRKVRVKAKSSSTPYPIWIEGEYITEPPIRPSDGAVRPAGHYIDEGGYPGANVYEIDINTMCRQTDAADRFGKPIYEQDR